jgi:hypothetical protein
LDVLFFYYKYDALEAQIQRLCEIRSQVANAAFNGFLLELEVRLKLQNGNRLDCCGWKKDDDGIWIHSENLKIGGEEPLVLTFKENV